MTTEVAIARWFQLAVPTPTDKNRAVQIGVHFEEVTEMLDALNAPAAVCDSLRTLSETLKTGMTVKLDALDEEHRLELLDALCDQIVTAIGVAHMMRMNIVGALAEVNRSNYSKFVNGLPVFNEHGKIAKGPGYSKPDLRPFVTVL